MLETHFGQWLLLRIRLYLVFRWERKESMGQCVNEQHDSNNKEHNIT